MFVLCVLNKRRKAKCRKTKTNNKYNQSTREYTEKLPVEGRFSAPVQTGPGAHPASCEISFGSLSGR
jgi:hypothetical protein